VDVAVKSAAEALVPYFVEAPPDSLAGLFHEAFLAEVPLAKLKVLFSRLRTSGGGPCSGVEVRGGDNPRAATLLFRFPGGKLLRAEISVDSSRGGKIAYLMFP
jgi:hypothetical protein